MAPNAPPWPLWETYAPFRLVLPNLDPLAPDLGKPRRQGLHGRQIHTLVFITIVHAGHIDDLDIDLDRRGCGSTGFRGFVRLEELGENMESDGRAGAESEVDTYRSSGLSIDWI